MRKVLVGDAHPTSNRSNRNKYGRLPSVAAVALLAALCWTPQTAAQVDKPAVGRGALGKRPNVVLVMTDDQGYGDMGCHGNKILKTPALDQLYRQSIRLTNFHVDPTCSPTRAALLTGRYSCRTGVWHTIMGRSLLRRNEVTFGDIFAEAGYRTGVFGKWHLGDNYPYRACDRGFHESLVHGGGGIGQTPDYWGNTYFDPVLCHNGKWEKSKGYCTDVFFDAAMEFIEANRSRPFFVYLPTNVPHGPYQVAKRYSEPYRKLGAKGSLAEFYGMITNFDENMARLLTMLDRLKLADNTILIYMTDNGTSGRGFNVDMRGRKGSVYEGGHRVPCFIRWPRKLTGGVDIEQLTAHIDILPTLMEFCEIPLPDGLKFDGRGLLPLLVKIEDWGPRTLFVQSHRIEHPQPWRQSAVMTEQYRLVGGRELYNIKEDPTQSFNLGPENPKIVDKLRFAYEEWYKDVSRRFDEYCEIVLGAPQQNPTELSCHDWHGPGVPWNHGHIRKRARANGFWAVELQRAGRYEFTLRERPAVARHPLRATSARLKIGQQVLTRPVPAGATGVTIAAELKPGKTRLQTWLAEPGGLCGAYYVEVKYTGPAAEKPLPKTKRDSDSKKQPKPPKRRDAYR